MVNLENTGNSHAAGLNGAVAAELRAERAALGWTNDDIAAASGIPKVSVQRYLVPKRGITMEILAELAHAMGTTPLAIMTRAETRLRNAGASAPQRESRGEQREADRAAGIVEAAEADAEARAGEDDQAG